ncbi:hypothetical protein [Ruminococcus sp.]
MLFVKWNGEPMNNQTPYGWLKEFCEKNDSTRLKSPHPTQSTPNRLN